MRDFDPICPLPFPTLPRLARPASAGPTQGGSALRPALRACDACTPRVRLKVHLSPFGCPASGVVTAALPCPASPLLPPLPSGPVEMNRGVSRTRTTPAAIPCLSLVNWRYRLLRPEAARIAGRVPVDGRFDGSEGSATARSQHSMLQSRRTGGRQCANVANFKKRGRAAERLSGGTQTHAVYGARCLARRRRLSPQASRLLRAFSQANSAGRRKERFGTKYDQSSGRRRTLKP